MKIKYLQIIQCEKLKADALFSPTLDKLILVFKLWTLPMLEKCWFWYKLTRRSAAVNWLSRHNAAPAPLFHGPVDILVSPRERSEPIGGAGEL